LIVAGTLVSCGLESESITEKDTTNFPTSAGDASQALAGVYQNLNEINRYPQESFHYYALLASDDMLGGGGANDKAMQAMDMMLNYGTDMTNDFYQIRYEGINRANTLIEALNNVDMDEDTKNQSLGEAKFMRAYFYYELASMYNRIPLVTTPETPSDYSAPTSAAIWGQILQDLYEAATTMPATHKQDGHVDKYCAEALLGRCWLFYTGMYCNGEDLAALTSTTYNPLTSVELPNGTTLTKQMVTDLIDDCVNNSGYSLVPDYRNLWAYTNRCTINDYPYAANAKDKDGNALKWVEDDNGVNPESMFAVKFNKLADWNAAGGIGYANGYALHFGVRGGQDYANTFPFGQGWGAGPVAPNLISDWKGYEVNDMRLEASVVNVADMPNYKYGGASWADFIQETDYYQKKIGPISCKTDKIDSEGKPYVYSCCFENEMYGWDGWPNGYNMQTNNIHDMVMIRFAEVLLMQSELKEDVSGINKVRSRAGLAPIGSYSLKALQNERRYELTFEGVRFNDIRRWHIAAAALEKQTGVKIYTSGTESNNTAHNGGYAARYNATAGFMKIPETQISLCNGQLEQNAGWAGSDSEYSGW